MHINAVPPQLGSESARLNALVSQMLRKGFLLRPTQARCLEVMQSIAESNPANAHPIEAVALRIAEADAAKEAQYQDSLSQQSMWDEIKQEGLDSLIQ